jgi:hypothetical protein
MPSHSLIPFDVIPQTGPDAVWMSVPVAQPAGSGVAARADPVLDVIAITPAVSKATARAEAISPNLNLRIAIDQYLI